VDERRPVKKGKAPAVEAEPPVQAQQETRGWWQRTFGGGKDAKDGQRKSNGSDGTDSPFFQNH
jgi:hypothetical protein